MGKAFNSGCPGKRFIPSVCVNGFASRTLAKGDLPPPYDLLQKIFLLCPFSLYPCINPFNDGTEIKLMSGRTVAASAATASAFHCRTLSQVLFFFLLPLASPHQQQLTAVFAGCRFTYSISRVSCYRCRCRAGAAAFSCYP